MDGQINRIYVNGVCSEAYLKFNVTGAIGDRDPDSTNKILILKIFKCDYYN